MHTDFEDKLIKLTLLRLGFFVTGVLLTRVQDLSAAQKLVAIGYLVLRLGLLESFQSALLNQDPREQLDGLPPLEEIESKHNNTKSIPQNHTMVLNLFPTQLANSR